MFSWAKISESTLISIPNDNLILWAKKLFRERSFFSSTGLQQMHQSLSRIVLCSGKDMWPSNSQGLNQVGCSLWNHFLHRALSNTLRSLDSLRAALHGEWQKIDVDHLRATVEAVTKRPEACMHAKGDHLRQYPD